MKQNNIIGGSILRKTILFLLFPLLAGIPLACGEHSDTSSDVTEDASQTKTETPQIDPEAFAKIRSAAEQGDAKNQFDLAQCYFFGDGVQKDYREAANWALKSAEQGYPDAQNLLYHIYNGEGLEPDYQEAYKWLRMAAEQGHPSAQYELGLKYFDGEEKMGIEQDYNKAVYWYRMAAEQGFAHAQNNLGLCYAEGLGVIQDLNKAVYWFRQAAEQGADVAQRNLAFSYYDGTGVEQDYKQAAFWFNKAAENGDVRAQYILATMYYLGDGVPKDLKKAKEWATKAMQNSGNAELRSKSESLLDEINSSLKEEATEKLNNLKSKKKTPGKKGNHEDNSLPPIKLTIPELDV